MTAENICQFFHVVISTPTLTWSVTCRNFKNQCYNGISTHTLTWSVTRSTVLSSMSKRNFNSHAHVERDSKTIYLLFTEMISTHTLTWSVTRAWYVTQIRELHFNSHAHVERDNFVSSAFHKKSAFQLTRSRGA